MTRTAFVIGHPVAHSRSPMIHGYWLAQYGIDGTYERIDVAPEALDGFVSALRRGAFAGGNATVPHKEAVLPLCDEIEDVARLIGAVNTVVVHNDRLFGINTDWFGFLANLDDRAPYWDRTPGAAMVLGAGGAARAIILGLSRRGFSPIRIFNRSPQRAEALAAELAEKTGADISGYALSAFESLSTDCRILVNTSTVGMHGTSFEGLPLECLPETALVSDIVYTPLVTPLLAAAAARGLAVVDGLGMLLHQAIPGFEAWFGVRPRVTAELRALIERDMGL